MKSPERLVAERQQAAERERAEVEAAAALQARAERTRRWKPVQEAIAPAFAALQATEWHGATNIQVFRSGFFGGKNVKRAACRVHEYHAPWKDTTMSKTVWLTSDRELVVNTERIVGDNLEMMLNGTGYSRDFPFEDVLEGLRRIAARVR